MTVTHTETHPVATAGPSNPEYIPEDSSKDIPEDSSEDSDDDSDDDDSTGSFTRASGITYSPYTPGPCKTAEKVAAEISQLSTYSIIRIYGADCNQVGNVLNSLAPGQKVFLGVDNPQTVESDIQSLISQVASRWHLVHTVSIGNEWVNSGRAQVGDIAGLVELGRSLLSGAGYNGPVVSVDTFISILNNPVLCGVGDYTAANAHAFYDKYVTAEGAGAWVKDIHLKLVQKCGRKTIITESGWPSQGIANNRAVPGHYQQQVAIKSIVAECGKDVFLFSAFDEDWKQNTAQTFEAEQHWGVS